jgi:RHS repeat-associated protein
MPFDLSQGQETSQSRPSSNDTTVSAPSITLPKGGGAIRGIGEKFSANPVTGTGSMSVPIAMSPGRSGFGPQLSLAYDSGVGNGPFGFGWSLTIPSITRKTDKGLPQYVDAQDSDVFILSGAEDLVPLLNPDGSRFTDTTTAAGYTIDRYRPRIEGLFARIERWTRQSDRDVHWRSISRDNILTLYGKDTNSRIADPTDSRRIFSWLICETRDDKGNAVVYEYKAEDGVGVDLTQAHEHNRGDANDPRRATNRYIKRIRYGNRVPLLDNDGRRPRTLAAAQLDNAGWMFEVLFDYDEGHVFNETTNSELQTFVEASTAATKSWAFRDDPFSSYRAGFEVRTCRLCQRVLMFHHFAAESGVGNDCLVRSTDFTYSYERQPNNARNPIYSFLLSVTHSGYKRQNAGYLKRSLPPVEYEYTQPVVQDTVQEVDTASLEHLPIGVDGAAYQWIDLHGEGIPGILSEQAGAWFYKRNISPISARPVEFTPLECVAVKPNLALAGGQAQFMDLAGDGELDMVVLDGPMPGLYEHDDDEGWQPFRAFSARLNRDMRDPNLKLVDLDGDGHADVLISEDDAFVWHASLTEQGFGPAQRVHQALDEEHGPRLVFADGTQSVYLADMSGDGLTDIVRIRNGEVCYWPNLGYGRFGAKVTMDNPPWFDHSDEFDHTRIRLADIDASGVIDIIYLHRDGVRLYFNQSGNSWGAPQTLPVFPRMNQIVSIMPTDLLGNGTACLVWSSPLPGDAQQPMRYVDLMGGQKPHLLVKTVNNLGAETIVQYAPSTKFYLHDKYAGKPWITRLPFPVHVVERVETFDAISRNRFVTRYAYHHGYFDGQEREFRGFGMVEQFDSEEFEDYVVGVQRVAGHQEVAPELYQPPVTTRTWYHTGAFFDRERILHRFRDEYYLNEQHIPDPVLPAGLDTYELRECLRSLKGLPLRQEIYSFDGSAQEQHPYSVVENNFEIRLLQPRENQRHAVFFPISIESVSLNYERNPADPRIAHSLSLEVDEYGHAHKSCSVVYGRKVVDPSLPAEVIHDQQKLYISYAEADYTPDIDQLNPILAFRLRTLYESRNYEITGIVPASSLFKFAEIKDQIAGTAEIAYEVVADDMTPEKRLLAHGRTLFLDNNLNPLPFGQWDSLGLSYQGYQLALTPSVTDEHYTGKVTDADFTVAGYIHFNGDANWWIPSGTVIYPANPADHFYLPIGARDPLGVETIATLDQYNLLVERVQIQQAAWAETSAINDYRVLGPVLITDPNKNRSAVEIDVLGMVVKSAVMGKASSGDGDTLADPTVQMEYELFNWMHHRKPNFAHIFAREEHGTANPRWQESYAYSNGSGGVAMVKAQAHPGTALQVNPDGTVTEVLADPRWVGNGRTILNNKGNPVKQYEPYFSTTHEYEDEQVLREIGTTPVLYYDAVGRNIRTLFPNGTLARVEFDPWMQRVFDANDTVKESQWYADRGSPDPTTQPEPLNNPERRAAWLAAKHADTPGTIHFDSLGRPVYAISDYGGGKTAAVRSEIDLTGRFSRLFDQAQREAASGFAGMAGTPIVGESAEKGRRWMFLNVLGALVKAWDEHERQFRVEYDDLHRPVSTFVQEARQAEILFNYVLYGDRHPNAAQLNLLGIAHQIFDQAGMVRVPELDFKGNPKRVERILAKDYKHNLDWNVLAAQPDYAAIQTATEPALETGEIFTASSQYDALNRPTQVTLPDGTVIVPTYNEANFLASLKAKVRGQGNLIEFLKDQDYDAKGQRLFAHYGNEVFTRYFYDPNTFRLTNLLTYKSGDDPDTQGLQNLHYTYDPVGNITHIRDDAQQTHYFSNAVVKPESLYEYDTIYQLIRATGREHANVTNNQIRTHTDLDFVPQLPHANNAAAVRRYTELYEYDLLGNILNMQHITPSGAGNWTRHYHYTYQDNPANRTNRLSATSLPGDPDAGPYSATYDYDTYGNMTRMPHLADMDWNFMDQLRRVDLGGGGTAYYVYGLGGQRIRKVIERRGSRRIERIYLGTVEIYRERQKQNAPHLERYTLHIADNAGRIAQVDTKTKDDNNSDPANPLNTPLIRYHYTNHLGSATLETDTDGVVISYEEYHPYGTSAYRSSKPGFDSSLKRYRFSGKELDDETALYYFGARYYATWLGRWTSSDPVGFVRGINLYKYCSNNPVMFHDRNGMADLPTIWEYNPGALNQTERDIVKNPQSPSADVLGVFEAHGYKGGGHFEWRVDEDTGWKGWVRTTPSTPETEEGGVGAVETPPPAEPPPSTGDGGSDSAGSGGVTEEPVPAEPAETGTTGTGGAAASQAAPSAERYIWHKPFRNEGLKGTQRGRILEWLYGVPWRSNTKGYDLVTDAVEQIKSTSSYDTVGNTTRSAARDASGAISSDPTGTMAGKDARPVIITPTDAPASVGDDIRTALNPGRGRKIPTNAAPPKHVRGLPGAVGVAGKALTGVGFVLSAYALGGDYARGDVPMGIGDALGTTGGGLELYAIASPGAAIAGVSAMTAGLAIGGVGIAVTSGVSMVRSARAGDTAGTLAGGVGVGAGLAIAAGAIGIAAGVAGAPVLLALGAVAALGVGIFHAGRYFDWW